MTQPIRKTAGIKHLLLAAGILASSLTLAPVRAESAEPEIEFKVLLIIKRETDAYSPLFLPVRSRMTDAEVANARRCFEVETPDMVREITGGKVRFTPTVYVSKTPLKLWEAKRLDSAEYDVRELVEEYRSIAKPGDYDSVGYYFLHYDRSNGYQIPRAGYGVGWYHRDQKIGVFAINCVPDLNPRDEVFLHEWIHGLDGFYDHKPGIELPKGYLHGGSNYKGYDKAKPFRPGDTFKGWMEWYRDYLNAQVRDGDELRGLGSAAWKLGPLRVEALAHPPAAPPRLAPPPRYPAWVYDLMKGRFARAPSSAGRRSGTGRPSANRRTTRGGWRRGAATRRRPRASSTAGPCN